MKVFRSCQKDEADTILTEHSCNNAGQCFKSSLKSSHIYNDNIKYLHFFKNATDILYLDTSPDRCICVYDIPEHILFEYQGIGKYTDFVSFKHLTYVEEFAIPSSEVKFDYLQSVNAITSQIDYEDMIENPTLIGLTAEIYNINNTCDNCLDENI